MDSLRQDLRQAVRMLLRARGFAALAILILALGIGATTAIYTVVNRVVLNPLPYPNADRILYLGLAWKRTGCCATALSPVRFVFWHEQSGSFDGLMTYRSIDATLGAGDDAPTVRGLRVTEDFFRVLGTRPAIGRAFSADETSPNGASVAILSDELWHTRFGGDKSVLGREIRLGDQPYTVIGVMPASFQMPEAGEWTQVLVPLRFGPAQLADHGNNYTVTARLKPGVSREQAQAEMQAISARFRATYPDLVRDDDLGVALRDYRQTYVRDLETTLWVMLGATAFVLLLACANVANLLLARAVGRQREIAVRTALGAGRRRILRQLVTESLVLGALAGLLGMLVSVWSLQTLLALAPQLLPTQIGFGLDARVILFSGALAMVSGTILGVAGAFPSWRLDLARALAEGGRSGSSSRGQRWVRDMLVATEAGVALVLLSGAGLLIASFVRLRSVDPGFQREGIVTARIQRAPKGYDSAATVSAFTEQVLERLRQRPGVLAAATVSTLPLQNGWNIPVSIIGRPDADEGAVEWRSVSPNYFHTFGIRLLRGRDVRESDRRGTAPVVIITQSMAEHIWPGQDPIGQRIAVGMFNGKPIAASMDEPPREVIGVVADSRQFRLGTPPRPTVYVPQAQAAQGFVSLPSFAVHAVRTDLAAPALREAIAAVDPRMPTVELATMNELSAASLGRQRFNTTLMAIFAALALVLTTVGIYAVVSYSVARRVREIGVRMALGAHPAAVVRLVMGQGMLPVVVGLGLGLVAALGLTRLLTKMLYGISPHDPAAMASVVGILAAISLLATYVPARRATRVSPLEALRGE